MKKKIIMTVVAVVTTLVFAACSGSSTKQTSTSFTDKNDTTKLMGTSVKYTCTMHPEVISDTPGACPKCGMTMVIKEMKNKTDMQMDSVKK